MKKIGHPSLIELACWLFCAFLSRSLLHDWTSFPLLDWSFTAFVIWIAPVFIYWLIPNKKIRATNPILLGVGVLLSLLGLLGELNVLRHSGLALASAGLLPWRITQIFWLATAAAWLPATAYLLRTLPLELIVALRLFAAILGAACLLYSNWGADDHQTS